MPTECWVDTDKFGNVVDASADGARLFNLSVRGLLGRALTLFFVDRSAVSTGLAAIRDGYGDWSGDDIGYRPRERRMRRVDVHMFRYNGGAVVRWWLGAGDAEQTRVSHRHPRTAESSQPSR